MTNLREAMARAIDETRNVGLSSNTCADAALAAIEAAGFTVVPREATRDMQRYGAAEMWQQETAQPGVVGYQQVAAIYTAMLAKAGDRQGPGEQKIEQYQGGEVVANEELPNEPAGGSRDANGKAERWYRAEDYPLEHEGREAWEFCEPRGYVVQTFVPKDYSRDPHHCGGLWFMRIRRPAPPTLGNAEVKP